MNTLSKIAFWLILLSIGFFHLSSALALVLGVVLALVFTNPYSVYTKKLTPLFLQISIIGLGFGMNLTEVLKAGLSGFGYTIISIAGTLFLGLLIGKYLQVEKSTSLLLSVGTAICGGSAIAAISPIIKAKEESISIALGSVFLLNALALLIFPPIGHYFHLSQEQFGLWSALAIHDTSSVVGASMQYGPEALQIGTTVKLARALWIIPLSFGIGYYWKKQQETPQGKTKLKIPWFILGFLLTALFTSLFPEAHFVTQKLELLAKQTLILTLFFIGTSLSYQTIKKVGLKPMVQGFSLWILVLIMTLTFVLFAI